MKASAPVRAALAVLAPWVRSGASKNNCKGESMELREAIGCRRSMRFLLPHKPVEREKIQRMLEAARLASFWGNVQALRAVVIGALVSSRSSATRSLR